jgi:hypothetical protein
MGCITHVIVSNPEGEPERTLFWPCFVIHSYFGVFLLLVGWIGITGTGARHSTKHLMSRGLGCYREHNPEQNQQGDGAVFKSRTLVVRCTVCQLRLIAPTAECYSPSHISPDAYHIAPTHCSLLNVGAWQHSRKPKLISTVGG